MKKYLFILLPGIVSCNLKAQSYVANINGTGQSVSFVLNSNSAPARTVEFWFNPTITINGTTASTGHTLLFRDNATQVDEFGFYIPGTDWPSANRGYINFSVRYGTVLKEIRSNSNSWLAGKWYHVCGVLDPISGMKLYIDGVLQNQTNATAINPIATNNDIIGMGKWGNLNLRYFAGKVDEVKFWSTARTITEINDAKCSCFNSVPGGIPNLITYYKFDKDGPAGGATYVNDDDGNSFNNWASFNGTWVVEDLTMASGVGCPQKNDFKIGLMYGFLSEDTATVALHGSNYTSQLNVLKSDGFNIVHDYGAEKYGVLPTFLNLTSSNSMMYLGNFKDFFSPTFPPFNTPSTGINIYNSPGTGGIRANYDACIQQIAANIQFKNTLWGVQSNEEAAYCHPCIYNALGTDAGHYPEGTHCTFNNNAWYSTEISPSYVMSARNYFKASFNSNNMDTKLISMEGAHGCKLTSDFASTVTDDGSALNKPIDFVTFLNPSDKRDIFFEESYNPLPTDANKTILLSKCDKSFFLSTDPTKKHYLNKFQNINLADDYANEVHSVLNIVEASDNNINGNVNRKSLLHSNLCNYYNGDYLWYQAYNSIINGVKGIWFYGAVNQLAYDDSEINKYNQIEANHYQSTDFPDVYNFYVRHLSRELAYLKNNGFLSTDKSSIIYSRTPETQTADVLPIILSTTLLPTPSLAAVDVQNFYTTNSTDPNFKPSYTFRTNGNDVVLIVTNPFPFGLQVNFDFGCINNEIIANSTGIQELFSHAQFPGVPGEGNYKQNRDGSINLQQNTIGSGGTSNLNFSNGKAINISMGPLDAMVFKFIKSTSNPWAGTNNGWDRSWSNKGDNKIGDWIIAPSDKFYEGDFNGDGKKNELICAQSGNGGVWMSMLQYSNGKWTTLWTNNGASHGLNPYRNNLIVGDFNGDGRDDLLGNDNDGNPTGADILDGYTTLFLFNNTDWIWTWSDGGHQNPPLINHYIRFFKDRMMAVDFDGDGKKDLLGFDNPAGWITVFNYNPSTNNFEAAWSDQGVQTVLSLNRNNPIRVGDFNLDIDPKDELLGLGNPSQLFRFEGNTFVTKLTINGDFTGWSLPIGNDTKAVVGNFDADNNDELVMVAKPGYVGSLSLQPNYAGWTLSWWATNTNPYLDDFYVPGSSPNISQWQTDNDVLPFYLGEEGPMGLLAIRKNCLGLVSLYGGNTTYKRQTISSDTSNEVNTADDLQPGDDGYKPYLRFKLFPNPAKEIIYCSIWSNEDIKNAHLKVTDSYGRIVLEKDYGSISSREQFEKQLELNLENGAYIVSLTTEDQVYYRKIIITK